jgi:hypothetical protein
LKTKELKWMAKEGKEEERKPRGSSVGKQHNGGVKPRAGGRRKGKQGYRDDNDV